MLHHITVEPGINTFFSIHIHYFGSQCLYSLFPWLHPMLLVHVGIIYQNYLEGRKKAVW